MASERIFTRREIEGRNTRDDTMIIIDNVVYDVTEFLEEHPGGAERLLDNGGRDASRCFRDVGHSEAAHEWREKFRRGRVAPTDEWPVEERAPPPAEPPAPLTLSALLDAAAPPLVLAALAALLYVYAF